MKSNQVKIQKNLLIVDKQNVGKTTYLYNQFLKLKDLQKQIFILDSATDHENKSLLKKVEKCCSNVVVICPNNEKQITKKFNNINEFKNESFNSDIFRQIIDNLGNIICFDLSYFLEKGYEYEDMSLYKYYRYLYNLLSQQIVLLLILMDKYDIINNSFVIMDEIEFPICDIDVSVFQKNIEFLASVHPENSFGTFYSSFEKIDPKLYTYLRRD